MRWTHLGLGMLGALASIGSLRDAQGSPVTWEFAGEITFNSFPEEFIGSVVGSSFSGSFTFDPTTEDANWGDEQRGEYRNVLLNISAEIGDLLLTGPAGFANTIFVLDDLSSGDQFRVDSEVQLTGETLVFRWTLLDSEGSVFSRDALPLIPPGLGELEVAQFKVFKEGGSFPGTLAGEINALVPEPTTLVALGTGTLVLMGRCWVRSHRKTLRRN